MSNSNVLEIFVSRCISQLCLWIYCPNSLHIFYKKILFLLTEGCQFAVFQDAVKVMAKDLVRTRRYVKKFIMMRAQIQAVSLKITTLKSQNSMAQAMKGVTKAMMSMNKYVPRCKTHQLADKFIRKNREILKIVIELNLENFKM